MINPFAVGHVINHPPPDVAANVKFVDFDLPFTFFPSYISRYFPFIESADKPTMFRNQSETRTKHVIRAVAIVAQETIAHGEELFSDYI